MKLLCQIKHQNICKMFAFSTDGPQVFCTLHSPILQLL
jgi:hypothetical protein